MKKFFSLMVAAIVCVLMSACASAVDKKCGEVADAMGAQNWPQAVQLLNEAYAMKGEASASNLADMCVGYQVLVNMAAPDNATRLEFAQKVVELYKSAMAKDAAAANKIFKKSTLDMASISSQTEQVIPQLEAAVAAESSAAAPAEEEEEATEEYVVEE